MDFQITEIIRNKRQGKELSEAELGFLLNGYLEGVVPDYQMAAWLMAVACRGMTGDEMRIWARLMWKSGVTFPRENREDFWVDKHSTGGVGDKTSLILVPWVHCVCEELVGRGRVRIPMISGRGLDFTGGTLDKLDSVPGFSSQATVEQAMRLLSENGFFMLGQTPDLAPADRLLYSLRDVTATVESIPLIVSSILSKKLAENLDGLVFDVKYGSGAFMPELSNARELAYALQEVARAQGVSAVSLLTRMDEPLGRKIGHQLEVEECADFLAGRDVDPGLYEICLELAAEMVCLASRGALPVESAREACERELLSRRPRSVFQKMFERQGGRWKEFEERRERLEARPRRSFVAPSDGYVEKLDARWVGRLLRQLGGGRQTKESSIDMDVGIVVQKKIGDTVKKGETFLEVVYTDERTGEKVPAWNEDVFRVSPHPVERRPWVQEVFRA